MQVKKIVLTALVALFAAVLFNRSILAMSDDGFLEARIGETTYRIPEEYGAGSTPPDEPGRNVMSIQFRKGDMGPLLHNVPGWHDNVNLLLSNDPVPVEDLYEDGYDGTPVSAGAYARELVIVSTEKINDNLTYQVMSGHNDIILARTNDGSFDGFMRCTKYDMQGASNACEYFFNHEGNRWKISFGKDYILDYRVVRDNVIGKMREFEGE